MMDRGFRDVRPLLGGFEAWKAAGQPVVQKPREMEKEAPRQSAPSLA